MGKFSSLVIACTAFLSSAFALPTQDQAAIEKVIHDYVDSWNVNSGRGFAADYTDDAVFVNIYGMEFKGAEEIEDRHIRILESFLKDSKFNVTKLQMRELQPGVVLAWVHWAVDGFRSPKDLTDIGTRKGIFTHVFVKNEGKWQIAAAQNTMNAFDTNR